MSIRAIVLVGMRGSGKTTLGQALAARLRWPFVDSDDELASAVGQPAGVWLAQVGEAAFRQREKAVVLRLLAAPGPGVIATGGGSVTIAAVRQALAATDLFPVWLQAPAAVLTARVLASPTPRPALTGSGPAAETEALIAQRAPFYAAASRLVVDTGTVAVDQAVAIVEAALRSVPGSH